MYPIKNCWISIILKNIYIMKKLNARTRIHFHSYSHTRICYWHFKLFDVNMSSVKCNIYALAIIIMKALILFLWLLNTKFSITINYPFWMLNDGPKTLLHFSPLPIITHNAIQQSKTEFTCSCFVFTPVALLLSLGSERMLEKSTERSKLMTEIQ